MALDGLGGVLSNVVTLGFVGLFVAVFVFVAYDTFLTARKRLSAKKHD